MLGSILRMYMAQLCQKMNDDASDDGIIEDELSGEISKDEQPEPLELDTMPRQVSRLMARSGGKDEYQKGMTWGASNGVIGFKVLEV
ncbi:hypothetical protein V6N13_110740 [Hibiscus sabdariffa]